MRRLWIYIGGGILLVVLLCFGGLYWLLETTSGARFALTTLTSYAGIELKAREVRGWLMDGLHLSGVEAKQDKMRATISSLDLSWEPRALLRGKLVVNSLALSGVAVQDDVPKKPPNLEWPRFSPTLRRFGAQVTQLKVRGLTYRHMETPPVAVTELDASLALENGLLTVSGLRLAMPDLQVSGDLAAGFWYPSLKVDLAAKPAKPVQGMDSFSLQARLLPAKGAEQVAGPIAIAGKSGKANRIEITGELGMTTKTYNLRRLTASRPGRRGTVVINGSVTPTVTDPIVALALTIKELDLAAELKHPALISGTVKVSGTPSDYRGNFALSNRGPGWESASLAANYRGNDKWARLDKISARVLQGTVTGAVEVNWSGATRIRGNLSGRGINPEQLAAGWPGAVNLDLVGNLDLPQKGGAKGSARVNLLESRLRGQSLRGDASASFAGESLRIERLLLVGRGFDLRASGAVDQRVDLVAHVSDLSRLAPDTAGRLDASGWVRYRDGKASGSIHGRGADLAVAGVRAAALQLEASLGEGKDFPVQVKASADNLSMGGFETRAALLSLQGTASHHTLSADLFSSDNEAHAALSGGYRNGVWRGELTRLDGRDLVGPFALAAPTPVMLSSSAISIAPLVINGAPGERVELAGEIRGKTGSLRGGWSALNLARANAWLPGAQLTGVTSGNLTAKLLPRQRIIVAGGLTASGTATSKDRVIKLQQLVGSIQGDQQGTRLTADLVLEGGSGESHLVFTSREPASLSLPKTGDLDLQLANFDLALLRSMTPTDMVLDGRVAGLVHGKLLPDHRVDLRGNLAVTGGHATWVEEGKRFDATLNTAEVTGSWHGRAGGGKPAQGQLQLHANAAATGVYEAQGQQIKLSRFNLRVDADQQGSRAGLEASLDQGGALRASFSSNSPAGLTVPETGDFAMEWGGIDPALLKPMLPTGLNVEGNFAGQGRGRILPGKHLEMAGEAIFSQGKAQWQGQSGEVNANLRSAKLAFAWRGDTLSTNLELALAENGQAKGNLVLPIPARIPVAPELNGALHGALAGKVQEKGFLTAVLPGMVQQSHGDLTLDLVVGGTWSTPRVEGTLQLANGGAYLPSAGITVTDVQLSARMQGDQIVINPFSAVSGGGKLQGNVVVRLAGWQVEGYSGSLSGERFQTVFLPELQMVTSPKLSFQGTGKTASLRGEVLVPELLVAGPPTKQAAGPSPDVILEGAPPASAKPKFPLVLDGQVRVVLGDKVQVKASGIDAKLGGTMDLVITSLDNINSSGEIRVVKGSYRAYGLDLEIVRGRLYYDKDPVTQPTLDILALRTVGDVKAGVTVGGYLRAPVVKLYSEPSMAEVDVLAYMLFGHPMGSGGGSEQAGSLALAASGLLSFGQSESVQEQIRDRLGLSVLGVESVNTQTAGRMGYKQVDVSPTGAPSKAPTTESLVTVGKYITPKLFVSYGRSLVTGGSLFKVRYDLFRRWQVETQSGAESGADIYYKLQFD